MVINGPLSADKKTRFFLQPGLDFIDDAYKFHNTFLFVGIGQMPNPDMTLWLMNAYSVLRNTDGKYHQRDTLRQQFDWVFYRINNPTLTSTLRLEERKEVSESPIAVRLRERVWLRLPFRSWPHHALSVFDEVIFNINNPAWIGTKSFFDENRLFIGINTQVTDVSSFDLGYMNQFLNKNTSRVNNILFFRWTMLFV